MTQDDIKKAQDSLLELKNKLLEARQSYIKNKYPNITEAKVSKADGMDGMGDSEDCCPPKDDYLYWFTEYLYKYVSNVESSFSDYVYNHAAGHLPKISGADKMQKALKTLGLEGDYEVIKPAVYVSASKTRHGSRFVL